MKLYVRFSTDEETGSKLTEIHGYIDFRTPDEFIDDVQIGIRAIEAFNNGVDVLVEFFQTEMEFNNKTPIGMMRNNYEYPFTKYEIERTAQAIGVYDWC